ncbi:acyl-CoA thioesterase [Szabonella alba]|uniref:Acyl-CoA thioesterase n=1 Tax=Szabonella alba TaxID=2804194 RepID=A0A8K0V7Z8_9RHOB|nr:thioesterase family protein [Szabonella alba]MBL4917048.1 acyl-CoA thioesterase [Szabonella alba]
MSYSREIQIEFNHCDPAGIVFYPRYFEMTNSVVENFFADVLRYPFSRITMEEGRGVPTARLEVDFRAPSRLGERLIFTLQVTRVGGASVGLRIEAAGGGILRLTADLVLVWISVEGRAEPWPDSLRQRLTDFMERSVA